jgi:hypothetical protein
MGVEMNVWATLGAAVLLAVVPVLPRFVPALGASRRGWAMSAAGGFSVAFVFLELLRQVVERAEPVSEEASNVLPFVEHEVLFLLLVGLTVFYALERVALRSRRRTEDESTADRTGFVIIVAFAAYAAIIGHLLWDQADRGRGELGLFTLAVGLHFFVVDIGLKLHHRGIYHHVGRWLLAVAVLLGWAVGLVMDVPAAVMGMLLAFVGGGVILITLKEELPSEKEGRVTAFVLGVAAFTALARLV